MKNLPIETEEPLDVETADPAPDGSTVDVTARTLLLINVGIGLAAVLIVWASFSTPWLWTRVAAGAEGAVTRQMIMARGPSDYETALLQWPLVAAGSLLVATLLGSLAGFLSRPNLGFGRTPLLSAWCFLAYGSFLCFLVGMRWAGFVFARSLDPGDPVFRLGAAPITLLAVGLCGIVFAGFTLRRLAPPLPRSGPDRGLARMHGAMAALAAFGLCAVALVPIARSLQPAAYRYDELTLAAIQSVPEHAAYEVANAVAFARACLWAGLALGALAWAALRQVPAEIPGTWRRMVPWLGLVHLGWTLALVVASSRTYAAIAASGLMRPMDTYVFPIIALLGLLGCAGLALLAVRQRRGPRQGAWLPAGQG